VSQDQFGYVNTTSIPQFVYLDGHNNNSVFPDGIPSDGTPIKRINVQPLGLVIVYYILSLLGIVFSIVCLLFNFIYRERRIVKLTSPKLNYFVVAGALCLYGSIYFRLYPESSEIYQHVRCNVSTVVSFVCVDGRSG